MRVKFSSIIAVISIILYVVAVGTGIVRILSGINERRDIARKEFYDLTDIASSAGFQGFMGDLFKETVRDTVLGSKTLQAVIVTGPLAEFTFERENKGIIIWEGNAPRFRTRFGYSPDPLFAPLRIDGLRNATITAVSNDIDFFSLRPILEQSLLIVLAAVLLSAVTLLLTALGGTKTAPNQRPTDHGSDAFEMTPPPEPPLKQEPVTPEPVYSAVEPEVPPPDDEESATREKLDEELRRCSDAELDLTLIIMELGPKAGAGIGDDTVVYRTFSGRVRQFFTSWDLVIEKGDRSISVILPGSNLEEGFTKARQFHHQMLTGLPELFINKADLRIGLSARSGRILGTDRLLLEASKAVERAGLEPESPIVAFKSDPEKYKAFVQKQGKKARGA
jgi:hypothetical protein